MQSGKIMASCAQNENRKIIFFDTKTCFKIGKVNFNVKSNFDENSEDLVSKLKRILKS